MRDRFQEDLFCEPPTWLVFYHLQSHSLWERSRTHRVERKKRWKKWGLLYRVPCWSDQFAMQNARGLGLWSAENCCASCWQIWLWQEQDRLLWIAWAQFRPDINGLVGWPQMLRCAGGKKITSDEAWWDMTRHLGLTSIPFILIENKHVRLLHDVAHCILYVSRSRILCWYVSEKRLSEVKVQDIQNALATRGMTARCSVGIHYSLANIFRSAEWFQVRSNEESLMVPHNVKEGSWCKSATDHTDWIWLAVSKDFDSPVGPVEDVHRLVHQAAIIEVADMPDGFLAALTKDGVRSRLRPIKTIDGHDCHDALVCFGWEAPNISKSLNTFVLFCVCGGHREMMRNVNSRDHLDDRFTIERPTFGPVRTEAPVWPRCKIGHGCWWLVACGISFIQCSITVSTVWVWVTVCDGFR